MGKLSEKEFRGLIQGGETNTVELKVAVPRAVIIGVRDATHEIVGVPIYASKSDVSPSSIQGSSCC